MSQPAPRPTALPSHTASQLRPSLGLGTSNTSSTSSTNRQSTQSSLLQARIAEKRTELASLQELRDLSAGLAGQMQQLEAKLATLRDGTEAVAEVLGNWSSVLRAIYMASSKVPKPVRQDRDGEVVGEELPQTLVRIPIGQAEAAQKAEAEASAVESEA